MNRIRPLVVGFTFSFAFLGTGCQSTKNEQPKESGSKVLFPSLFLPNSTNSSHRKPVESSMEEELLRQGADRDPLRRKLLQQKTKFRAIAATCLSSPAPPNGKFAIDGQFYGPFNISEKQYIVALRCGFDVQPELRLFVLDEQKGMNTVPLKVTLFDVDPSGKVVEHKTQVVVGYPSFNKERKELWIEGLCRQTAGRYANLAKYQFQNGQLVLQEFWLDNQAKCSGNPRLKRIYP